MNKYDKIQQLHALWDILDDAQTLLCGKRQREAGNPTPDFSVCAADDCIDQCDDSPAEISAMNMNQLVEAIEKCKSCGLCDTRNHPVPGKGVMKPKVMIIGEAPGAQEDATGEPFVGRSGDYLDTWLNAIGLSRETDIFLGNIMKCRPPKNRDPSSDEQKACIPYLLRQLELIKPKMILCLGRVASQILLETTTGIGRLRGQTFTYQGIPLMVTYHPSAVLRYPDKYRRPVWEDLQRVQTLLATFEDEG